VIRLVAVEVAKVRTTRFWIGLLLGGVALVTLGVVATLAVAGSPEGREAGIAPIESLEDVRSFIAAGSIVGAFALVLGATAMTSEHRHRTLSGTFLATPTRWPVVVAKVIGSGIAGLVFGVIGASIPLLAVVITFAVDGKAVPLGPSVAVAMAAVAAGSAFSAAMGAAAGAALRSQLVAILGVLGWALVVESVIGAILPGTVKWLPFTGLTTALTQTGTVDLLSPLAAGLLMALYLAVALAVGLAVTMARDVE
jgi:ABC-2 type transport system permease protein